MSWNAFPSAAAYGAASSRGADSAEHRQHLQADHLGGAVHVAFEGGPVGIVRHGQVHPHRARKSSNISHGMPYLRAVCTTARSVGSSSQSCCLDKPIEQLSGQPLQPFGTLGGADRGVEVVEDVVGPAGEPIERVDCGTLFGGQQPGGEEECAAVLCVERAAAFVRVAQGRVLHTGGIEFGADHVRAPDVGCDATGRRLR